MNAQNSILTLYNSALVTQYSELSFDDSVRPHQHIRWNRQADLLGGFQIDDQLEFRWLLHGQIGGLCAFEDLVYVGRGAAIQIPMSGPYAMSPPSSANCLVGYMPGKCCLSAISTIRFE